MALAALSLLLWLTFQDASAQIPEGMSLSYYSSLPATKILIWGGDTGQGLDMSRFAHSRCALLLLVGKNAEDAEAAATQLLAEPPVAGTCPPGVEPVVHWDAGDIHNATYVLHLTARYESTLGGSPDISWNFAE
mmetsp:Transcript_90180/g.125304  ORF Transcript_90180/g.125304 Transcript_90180/m.125304 type:complete len:134 (+) Transcript_90180:70-471(+)|eukprot:s1324_g31.t1